MGALRGSSGSHGSYVDLSKFDVQEKHVLENLTDANLQQLAADAPANHKFKTRIICTLGPVSREVAVLEEMLKKGMNIARFNFSHGDHEYHKGTLDNLRIASKNLGIRCGVLLDTKGPEIRTGMLDHGEPVFLEKDSEITLTTDYDIKGNKNLIAVSYASLAKDVAAGSKILCADGSITFTVLSCDVDAGTVQVRC